MLIFSCIQVALIALILRQDTILSYANEFVVINKIEWECMKAWIPISKSRIHILDTIWNHDDFHENMKTPTSATSKLVAI